MNFLSQLDNIREKVTGGFVIRIAGERLRGVAGACRLG